MDEYDNLTFGIVIAIIAFLVYAFAIYARAALRNLNEEELKKQVEEKNKQAKILQDILKKEKKYFVCLHLILISASIVLGLCSIPRISTYFLSQIVLSNTKIIPYTKILLEIGLILINIYLLVLFTDIIPNRFFRKNSKWIYHVAKLIRIIYYLYFPLIELLYLPLKIRDKLFGEKIELEEEIVTEQEIMQMVNESHEQGNILETEAKMITNIFEFGDKEAKDIMIFRKKIIAVDANLSIEEAVLFMLEQNFSRFPIYEEDIDNIIGILHLKDVMKYYIAQNKTKTLKEIASPPFFVHETQEINKVFQQMQIKKVQMAIVVDEYGQTEGILAMEDILEVIVGNILDEYDEEERNIIALGTKGEYLVRAMTRLDEVEDLLGIEFPEEDIDTLNGFLICKIGHLPKEHEEVTVIYEGYEFKPIDIYNKVIRQVKISKIKEELDSKTS